MNRPLKWRYMLVGLGFLGLAGVRASQDAPAWAAVFAVAAVVNFWLGVHEGAPSAAVGAASRQADPPPGGDPGRDEMKRSAEGYRTSARQWQVLGAAGVVIGGGLLLVEPALALFAGAVALFSLHRAHRAGRAVSTLRRAVLEER